MSKITNDGLTRSGTDAVRIRGNSGRQRVKTLNCNQECLSVSDVSHLRRTFLMTNAELLSVELVFALCYSDPCDSLVAKTCNMYAVSRPLCRGPVD